MLSDDYLSVADEEIKHITSHMTVVGGQIVHADSDFASLAPPALPAVPSWAPHGEPSVYVPPTAAPVACAAHDHAEGHAHTHAHRRWWDDPFANSCFAF